MTAALRTVELDAIRYGEHGLVAAVCQDASDGRVLMIAWLDAEAIEATLRTRQMHFHSRSRGRLWRKGETSGNVLGVAAASLDCDGDAILWSVTPTGPACHTGMRSCFDLDVELGPGADVPATQPQGFEWLETLWATIDERARLRPAGSYTTRLLDAGVDLPARKVAEEAVEVLMAAKDDAVAQATDDPARDQGPLAGEMGDLLYHLLVLCAERGLPPAKVLGVLRARHS
ncbi:MAG: bifunctional phosphoribosyl-AMP cyclohydrolase/phosphoribosyl-ATP diphosphatase HisIE [Chloroflexi bacterium]|nr:bifunctional phosphoribosyl-AMP cyclohydrolase/phosphoribosyl-ATP diphosphatase HisIE [Chloroflexota bacterium]